MSSCLDCRREDSYQGKNMYFILTSGALERSHTAAECLQSATFLSKHEMHVHGGSAKEQQR